MANLVIDAYRNVLGTTGGPNLTSADIRVILIDLGAYTFSSAHDFLDDIAAGARIAVSTNLSSKTYGSLSVGTFDADDITITSITGATVEALYLYQHTGVESTSRLLAFWDTGVSGIVFTPSGGNAIVQWPAGGIFTL